MKISIETTKNIRPIREFTVPGTIIRKIDKDRRIRMIVKNDYTGQVGVVALRNDGDPNYHLFVGRLSMFDDCTQFSLDELYEEIGFINLTVDE